MRLFRILFLALALALALCGPAAADTILHQGVERAYRITGQTRTPSEQPAVVFLHGFRALDRAADVRDLDAIAWSKLEALGAGAGFVTVSPAAYQGRWNMGIDLPNLTLRTGAPADDVGFIFRLVDHLVASEIADPNRIYLAGISDGGIMTNILVCARNHPFAAAASVIGTMYTQHGDTCRPDDPIPMLIVAGTHDPVLPYDGWMFPGGRTLSVPEIAEFWRLKHGCDGQRRTLREDRVKRDYTRILQVDWTGCDMDAAVRLLRVEGGAHRVPSFEKHAFFSRGWTGRNRDIETADELWRFFSQAR